MNDFFKGRIIKALSGFYYVRLESGEVVECRARGIFRKNRTSPLVGDEVSISRQGKGGTVEQIFPRRNCFVRPAVSNLDLLVILASESNPISDPFLIDRVSAIAGEQNVPVLLCINKIDLKDGQTLAGIYQRAGFKVYMTSAETGEGIEELRTAISGKTVAFTGNSGVGKSSVLNCLNAGFSIKTGDVSDKLGRGRHTTRHVELYLLEDGTCVMDTPGFSSFDTEQMELTVKENLQYAFPDFAPFMGKCRYHDCAHIKEPECAVLEALEKGQIEPTRHASYVRLYEEARKIRLWELKQK